MWGRPRLILALRLGALLELLAQVIGPLGAALVRHRVLFGLRLAGAPLFLRLLSLLLGAQVFGLVQLADLRLVVPATLDAA
jgi:hypothetical protein